MTFPPTLYFCGDLLKTDRTPSLFAFGQVFRRKRNSIARPYVQVYHKGFGCKKQIFCGCYHNEITVGSFQFWFFIENPLFSCLNGQKWLDSKREIQPFHNNYAGMMSVFSQMRAPDRRWSPSPRPAPSPGQSHLSIPKGCTPPGCARQRTTGAAGRGRRSTTQSRSSGGHSSSFTSSSPHSIPSAQRAAHPWGVRRAYNPPPGNGAQAPA